MLCTKPGTSEMNFEQYLVDAIKQSEYVDFAEYGDGEEEMFILEAEKDLGFKFPDTYRWWLLNFSGGSLANEEIYSVYPDGNDSNFSGGDIRCMYKTGIKNFPGTENFLTIFEPSGWDEVYYFKINEIKEGKEKVYVNTPGYTNEKMYSDNFVKFLIKLIEDYE
jgi:hypothetical protein